jgi:hypothetical protein
VSAFLPESLPHWKPFPDTNEALKLSSVDDDLLAGTRRHLAVTLSVLVPRKRSVPTSRLRGTSRPRETRSAPGAGFMPRRANFHDVEPAVAHGIPIAWINRKGERPTGAARPDREFRTLTELAEVTLVDFRSEREGNPFRWQPENAQSGSRSALQRRRACCVLPARDGQIGSGADCGARGRRGARHLSHEFPSVRRCANEE